MTRYPYLLFDADNTLFDFDEANVSSFRAVLQCGGWNRSGQKVIPGV